MNDEIGELKKRIWELEIQLDDEKAIKKEKEEVLMYLDTQGLNLMNLSQVAELTTASSNLSEGF